MGRIDNGSLLVGAMDVQGEKNTSLYGCKVTKLCKMGGGNALNKINTMCFPCFQPLTCEMFAIAEAFNSKGKRGRGHRCVESITHLSSCSVVL